MTKRAKAVPQPLARKTPITQEAARRVQSSTAAKNSGHQSGYARRLQSVADQRAAEAAGAPASRGQGSRTAS